MNAPLPVEAGVIATHIAVGLLAGGFVGFIKIRLLSRILRVFFAPPPAAAPQPEVAELPAATELPELPEPAEPPAAARRPATKWAPALWWFASIAASAALLICAIKVSLSLFFASAAGMVAASVLVPALTAKRRERPKAAS